MTLTDLIKEYAREQPNRAEGGLRALSGFDFQLRCYLAEFVESLTNTDASPEAGQKFAVDMEALSDYTVESPAGFVCVQVKRTLTTTTMASAAVEFATIEEFLSKRGNEHMPPLFSVVGHQSSLRSHWSWSDVSLPAKVIAKRPQLESIWRTLVNGDRLEAPVVKPDPWWRVISATYHRMDHPFEFARKALDLCLQRHKSSAEQVRDDIAELFKKQLRQTSLGSAQAVTVDDFELELEDRWQPLRVGFRPSLALLRNGQYMLRAQHIPNALEILNRLQQDQAEHNVLGLPVLWISGPSGSGKSVLLLQMMEAVVREGVSTVWLDDDAERLVPLLKSLCDERDAGSRDLPELIFIDDLYAPQNQQRLDLSALELLISKRPFDQWPVIVTCGPTEFHDRLKREARGSLHLRSWTLPLVAIKSEHTGEAAEADVFAYWYQQRSGEPVSCESAFDDRPGLMISMSFELRFEQADLLPFATRFRDRLKQDGLHKSLVLPLALNRLYLWAPADWLDESDRERLDEVNRHNDFSVLELQGGGELLRLTHPHISDAIYRAIRDPGSPRAYANDLVEALKRASVGHASTLCLLLRSLSSDDPRIADRLADIDLQHLIDRVAKDWDHTSIESRLQKREIADVRTSWACWHARQPELGIERQLGCSVLEGARVSLRDAGPRWARLWQLLHAAYPKSAVLLHDAVEWLHEPSSGSFRGWSFIWEDVWGRQSVSEVDRAMLAKCAQGWLVRHWNQDDWHYVWTHLVQQPGMPHPAPTHDEIVELGWQWLLDDSESADREASTHLDRAAWAFIWRDLLAQPQFESGTARAELLTSGFEWLTGREARNEWTFIWQDLVRSHELPEKVSRDELLTTGFEWLAGRKERNEWTFIWQELVQSHELPETVSRDELLTCGNQWLNDREERGGWTAIWRILVESEELPEEVSRDELLLRGFLWAIGREEHTGWPFIWRDLVESQELPEKVCRDELLLRGFQWLTGREEHSEWNYIWQKLAQTQELPKEISRDELLTRGFQWLTDREDRSGWSFIWQILAKSQELPEKIARDELLLRGFQWLTGREELSDWTHVWEKLVETQDFPNEVARDKLLTCGFEWLTGREGRNEWSHIWQKLVELPDLPENVSRDELLTRGFQWLTSREELSDWAHVWETLVKTQDFPNEVARDELLTCGFEWLTGREGRNEWSHIWQNLVELPDLPENVSRDELLTRGFQWLTGREERSEWSHVWQELIDLQELPKEVHREELLLHGFRWLTGREESNEWNYIWQNLVELPDLPENVSREELLTRGFQWLTGREERSGWSHTWRKLVELPDLPENVSRDELLTLGFQWLTGHEERSEWGHMWQKLVNLQELPKEVYRDELLLHGFRWLTGREESNEWNYIWQKLVELPDLPKNVSRDDLLTRGFQWLTGQEERSGWSFVWQKLVELPGLPENVSRDELLTRGFQWLKGREERSGWSFVWQILAESQELPEKLSRDELFLRGYQWLTGLEESSKLYYFSRKLVDSQELPKEGWCYKGWNPAIDISGWAALLTWLKSQPGFADWETAAAKFQPGTDVTGVVRTFVKKGANVELASGVSGRLHVSNLSWTKRFQRPGNLLEIGQQVCCRILRFDAVKRKIELGLKQLTQDPWLERIPNQFRANDRIKGVVKNIAHYGVFVELEPHLEGLLHISEIPSDPVDQPGMELQFQPGHEIEVRIIEVDSVKRKIALSQRFDADLA